MTDDTAPSNDLVTGLVKWFDPTKGFGFVVADGGGPDILLHANVLRNFGQSSVADGSRLTISVHETERGVQAFEVHDIIPPKAETSDEDGEYGEPDAETPTGPLYAARVKWFDKAKGFGFANIFGRRDDVFIHVEVLRRSGLADLQPGEAVGLRITDGHRGIMASEVTSWDVALSEPQDI